jgi:dihydroxyacetone kinase-like predicted kinase
MDAQETEFSAGHRAATRPVGNVSLVVVASGEGLIALFADLGACEVIDGGRTKNPSVNDIVEAIENAPTRDVVILPNDGNVVPAAKQAAELSEKSVEVAPTTSIPQGVAAALAFNAEGDAASNLRAMEAAYGAVKSGEVTAASRDVTLDGITTVTGEFIGILEGALVAAGPVLSAVLDAVIEAADVGDDDLVTLFRGEPVSELDAGTELARLSGRFADAEFELVNGDQPFYHYLLSIE